MSRRPASLQNDSNAQFVSADALLAQALEAEATKASDLAPVASIGSDYSDAFHKCSYTVDVDGSVSCKGCGKGKVKKASHGKHRKPGKSY